MCSVCPSQEGEWGGCGSGTVTFGGTLAAAELSPALGFFLPVQREVVVLHSDALSLVQSAGTIQRSASLFHLRVPVAGTKETMSKAGNP